MSQIRSVNYTETLTTRTTISTRVNDRFDDRRGGGWDRGRGGYDHDRYHGNNGWGYQPVPVVPVYPQPVYPVYPQPIYQQPVPVYPVYPQPVYPVYPMTGPGQAVGSLVGALVDIFGGDR